MSNKKSYATITTYGPVQVKMDRAVAAELENKKLRIAFNPIAAVDWEYPWVFQCEPSNCPVEPLHLFVWRFMKKEERPLRAGEILHHKNHDKNDARIANLGPGTPALHAKVHALTRQRFTIRRKTDLTGYYRPHAPGDVRDVTGEERTQLEKRLLERQAQEEVKKKSSEQWKLEQGLVPKPAPDPEVVLGEVYDRLRPVIGLLDSGKPIPPPPSRPRESDRLLQSKALGTKGDAAVGRARLGCTRGEAGLVFALIDQGFDVLAVSKDVKLSEDVIRKMMTEPAVSKAIENWHRYQRLPKPNSAKKLGVWGTALKKRRDRKP